MSEAGLIFVRSRIYNADKLSPELFAKWYDEVHVRDILSTGGIKTAIRWESTDDAAECPYLTLYAMEDLQFLRDARVKAIPVHNEILPGPTHYIWDFVVFDARVYAHVQTYEPEGTKPGPGDLLMYYAVTPAPGTEDDYDAFYRQEHCKELAKCTGYRRTRRYKLQYKVPQPPAEQSTLPPIGSADPPIYLVLHEFDGQMLPQKELEATTETRWAKRVVGGLVKMEAGVFKLLRAVGEMENRF
ncbi:MAG: hypothetical protein M1818_002484 [Claussenomyces sp. TS43310]|nr:MAG: hypothetical protein M1818_002484 [Claussenomyces sp. TS43310]